MLGLEAMTGTLDDFGFEDYLNGITIHTKIKISSFSLVTIVRFRPMVILFCGLAEI